ncbi:hypothetical protein ACA910_015003 [Epithemia clementina (nom. ined.)]
MSNTTTDNHGPPSKEPPPPQRSHIRPRVRNRVVKASVGAVSHEAATDQKNEMNSASTKTNTTTTTTTTSHQQPVQPVESDAVKPPPAASSTTTTSTTSTTATTIIKTPKGILRKSPKYTKRLVDNAAALSSSSHVEEDETANQDAADLPFSSSLDRQSQTRKNEDPAVKDLIVERKPRRRKPNAPTTTTTTTPMTTSASAANTHAIEGYVPAAEKGEGGEARHRWNDQPHEGISSQQQQQQSTLKKHVSINEFNTNSNSPKREKGEEERGAGDEDTKKKKENGQDLIFHSLADLILMEQAGTLQPNHDNEKAITFSQEGTVIEADLSFSVMSPEEFEATMNEQDEGATDDPALNNNNNNNDDEEEKSEKENSQDDEGEGSFWDLLGKDDDDDDNDNDNDSEPVRTHEERAFLQLWKALSQWVTPIAVEYVFSLQQQHKQQQQQRDGIGDHDHAGSTLLEPQSSPVTTPRRSSTTTTTTTTTTCWSDVESTRCAGLMSLLQLYLVPCLQQDLHQPLDERRTVEQRLGQFLRLLDYRRPSPRLNARQARALTCILIQTVRPEYYYDSDCGSDDNDHSNNNTDSGANKSVPPSCQAVGLTAEEHRYLVQSAIVNFRHNGGDDLS